MPDETPTIHEPPRPRPLSANRADVLPPPRREPSERIDRRALPVWRIGGAVNSLFLWIIVGLPVAIAITAGVPRAYLLPLLALPLLYTIVVVFVIPPVQWRRWRYEVTEREIDLQRGVFIVTRTLIPMSRVQHVDTQQGPLLRMYGLAGVSISTAAGAHEIPALSIEVADDVRDRISRLAGVSDDV
jgi:uncharacterized protein